MENDEQTTPAPTETPAPETPPATPAPAAAEPPPKEAPPVVDVLGDKFSEEYPELREMEEAAKSGLKFPTDRKWLDEQMKDSRFRGFVHGLRGMATREREATVNQQKALQAERDALAKQQQQVEQDRLTIRGELAKFEKIVQSIPKAPAPPTGGMPDPKNPDPKVQEFYAQRYVAKMFEPVLAGLQAMTQEQQQAEESARAASTKAAVQAFISKTPDYMAHHERVKEVLNSGEATTIEGAYHIVKARVVAAAPPPPAQTGPNIAAMTADEVTIYELEHPGWKRPADWRTRIKR